MEKNTMEKETRNYGLDLLRMVSMFFVVILHVLGQGGVLHWEEDYKATYYAAWLLEVLAYCAVDCYGILSGYVGIKGRHRPERLLQLWLNVFFYSAGITLLFRIFSPKLLVPNSLWAAIFPASWYTYWYFSGYFGLFFAIPYLNKLVNALDERERRHMVIGIFLLFCGTTVIPRANGLDYLRIAGGYSFVWLCILYLFGACIRTCSFPRWKKYKYLLLYAAVTFFSWAFGFGADYVTKRICGEPRYFKMFIDYTAPTIMIAACCLLLFFEQLQIRREWIKKCISTAAPLAFSVYLIHAHPLIWVNIFKNIFSSYAAVPWPVMVAKVLKTALLIYVSCSVIDFFRVKLFQVCRVKEFTQKLFKRD